MGRGRWNYSQFQDFSVPLGSHEALKYSGNAIDIRYYNKLRSNFSRKNKDKNKNKTK